MNNENSVHRSALFIHSPSLTLRVRQNQYKMVTPEGFGFCARCNTRNSLELSHCQQCGARLPWLPPTAPSPLVLMPPVSTVRIWPFLSGESQKLNHALSALGDFLPTQACLGSGKRSGLAIDEGSRQLCLLKISDTKIERHIFRYADILGCEIVEDGYIIASTSGLNAGLPALRQPPRGLNNHARTSHSVELVALKLVFNAVEQTIHRDNSNDTQQPGETLVHIVRFLHKSTPRQSSTHKAALAKANDWYRLIMALMQLISIQSPRK